ncbi:hypothetical protein J437_LFUL002157 [Ladona fulva]|uniref:Uncharacterized protein n=1 Tax=Ladona fulva TaxID=123851 RepID=A0A8K0NWS7_LADFU|nr:hypothetical protein J437_LFUL002157 [Ladona fulva]
MLSSFWGRFGMRDNLPQCSILRNKDELLSWATNPRVDLLKVIPINEEVANLCAGAPIPETNGRTGQFSLCILGRPYSLGATGFMGKML